MDRLGIAAEALKRQRFSNFRSSFHLNKFAVEIRTIRFPEKRKQKTENKNRPENPGPGGMTHEPSGSGTQSDGGMAG